MFPLRELGKRLGQGVGGWLERHRTLVRMALGTATGLALAAIVAGYGYQVTRVSLVRGERSDATLVAPRTATYVDTEATARLRAQAEQAVAPVFELRQQAAAEAESEVDRIFAALSARDGRRDSERDLLARLPPPVAAWAAKQPAENLASLATRTRSIVRGIMQRSILNEGACIADARMAAAAAAEALPLDPLARALAAAVAQQAVRPNLLYDAQATQARRRAERELVRPVERTIHAGEVILRAGEVATARDIAALRAVGLLGSAPDLKQLASIALLCALAVVGTAAYLRCHQPHVYDDTRLLLLTALVALLALFTVNLVNLRGSRAELLSMLSVTAGAMIIAVLVGNRTALMVAVVESLLVGIMAQGQLSLTILTLGSSLTGLLLVRHIWPPSQLVGASVVLGAVNTGLAVLVSEAGGGEQVVSQAWHSLLYGLGAPAVAVGGIFLLQRPFDITTHLRLIELANPNEPLLRRMLVEVPGTYSDSFLVANLAEAGAEAVGADGLLARVGSYYHDIGKLRRPYLFSENQVLLGIDNIHEQLSPSLSSLVITSHVKDGVELAREYRLPRIIRDIIAQHHGTALVSFFYHQARADARGQGLPEASFRYPGPKPRTREAAIIMLADAAFAAVWSLPQKTPARVEAVVRQIVRERLEDGQLAECPLTLRDLTAITDAFLRLLKGIIFHTRVEYPQLAEAGAAGRSKRASSSGHSNYHSSRPRRE